MADMLLPVWVYGLPARFVFQPGGAVREKVRHAIDLGCMRVIAGPELCHVVIDVKRPYIRAVLPPEVCHAVMEGQT